MRYKDKDKMQEILEFAEQFYLTENRSPSTSEIATHVGFTRATVYRYLLEMNEKGMISYDGKHIVSNVTLKYSKSKEKAPICGSIPCGSPMEEVENIEQIVSLPTQIFGQGPLYMPDISKRVGISLQELPISKGSIILTLIADNS